MSEMNASKAWVMCCVENVPEYALSYRYWIVTPVKGQFWFWGAYRKKENAESNRREDQMVVEFNYVNEQEEK